MQRRATILTALVAVLVMASGAMAGDKFFVKTTNLSFPANIDSSVFCDTATSRTFGVDREYSEIVGKIYRVTVDTIFDKDSVSFSLEAKVDDDYDSTWYTIWATAAPLEDDNVGGVQTTINVQMADSSASIWNEFRWNFIFHCDDDSTGDHGATFDWPAEYRAKAIFRKR
jgi:hypothetical protein